MVDGIAQGRGTKRKEAAQKTERRVKASGSQGVWEIFGLEAHIAEVDVICFNCWKALAQRHRFPLGKVSVGGWGLTLQ